MTKKKNIWILGLVCSTYMLSAANTHTSKVVDSPREVVVDKSSNLIWQDNKHTTNKLYTWNEAVKYCQDLVLDGHSNWRVPEYEELLSIVDYQYLDPAILKTFKHVETSSNYWTNTRHVENEKNIWIVYFYNGYTYIDDIKTENYVRCVHTI